MLKNTSLQTKLTLIPVLFFLLFLFQVSLTFWNVREMENDAHVINLAGRQRMLIMFVVKEVAEIRFDVKNRDWHKEELKQGMKEFEGFMKAFIYGNEKLKVRPSQNPKILAEITQIVPLWKKFKGALIKASDYKNMEKQEYEEALNYIFFEAEHDLLDAADSIASHLERESVKKVGFLLKIQLWAVFIGLLLVLLGWAMARQWVFLPVKKVVDILEGQRTLEDYRAKIPVHCDDEIGKMIAALNESAGRIVNINEELKNTQAQLLHSEKMSSIGQLAAGVAHEINNPIGFIHSNLNTLGDYINDIKNLLNKYAALEKESALGDREKISALMKDIESLKEEIDLGFLLDDVADLVKESREGSTRVAKIVRDLKEFSHADKAEVTEFNINEGIESTLNIVWNELKYKAEVIKEFGDVPLIPCYAHQINQVILNILVNAAQAMRERGEIRISTRHVKQGGETGKGLGECVEVKISDTGSGISPKNQSKLFDPFFTTKEVGKGTGLGLSIAYGIIKKHGGEITVESKEGKGTTFTIQLPVEQPEWEDTDKD